MQDITTTAELKNAIRRLEVEQTEKGQLLKNEFFLTFESLNPVNLIKNTLGVENILGSMVDLSAGFLSKKILLGVFGSKFRKVFGYMLQFGVTNFVAQHHDTIKSLGQTAFKYFINRKQRT